MTFDTTALPAAPRRIRIGMPHLDVGGLSEGWFLRYAGDLHWEAIGRQLEVATHEIQEEDASRIYPTVVALRARFELPLSTARENDVLQAAVEVVPCGRACAEGRVVATVGGNHLSLHLLTTFASRGSDGAMRTAVPAARLAARWRPEIAASPFAALARAARRGDPIDDTFAGPALTPCAEPLGRVRHEPSPYADYNGARLLYFAAYPSLADTAERRLVKELGLHRQPSVDWAVATSPVRRDVFFYGNLPLGDALVAELLSFERDVDHDNGGPRVGDGVKTRVRLRRASDDRTIADVVTRRLFVVVADVNP